MMMSPILNGYLTRFEDGCLRRELYELVPLFVLCFVWSWPTSYNVTLGIVPRTAGLGHFSGIMMVGMYVVGRLVRFYRLDKRIPLRWAVVAFALLLIPALLKLGFYNSPVAVGLSVASFVMVSHIRLSDRLSRFCVWLAPSMFSVYMLHTGTFCMHQVIPNSVKYLLSCGINKWPSYLIVAIGIFVVCTVVDLLRRGALALIRK